MSPNLEKWRMGIDIQDIYSCLNPELVLWLLKESKSMGAENRFLES